MFSKLPFGKFRQDVVIVTLTTELSK